MERRIVLLSGAVSSGKSTLAQRLGKDFHCEIIKTNELIREYHRGVTNERRALQEAGKALDVQTRGKWVRSALEKRLSTLPENVTIVIDSVRIKKQIDAIRQGWGSQVLHIHLDAPIPILEKRYAKRPKSIIKELSSYKAVGNDATEKEARTLGEKADVCIDTYRCTEHDVVVRAATYIGLYERGHSKLVDVIIGGQYGSEGKGNIASFLAKEYDLLVRVGGPNAGHKVYAEPEPIGYHHLPSGTEHSEADLVIGPGAVINHINLLGEIAAHKVTANRLSIDPNAIVITKGDIANEKRLQKEIGSTGQGVGAATARRVLRFASNKFAKDIADLRPFIRPTGEVLEQAFCDQKKVMLEGTQGTGLSLYHGFYPYVTSRDTTVSGCLAEAGIAPSRVRKIVMVCRTYPIRVQSPKDGTSGQMSQEIDLKEIHKRSGISITELEKIERTTTTKRKRRIAEFDWTLLRRAAFLNGPTDIALTFADYIDTDNKKARRFSQLTPDTIFFVEEIERVARASVSLISTRFHFRNIIDRRNWK